VIVFIVNVLYLAVLDPERQARYYCSLLPYTYQHVFSPRRQPAAKRPAPEARLIVTRADVGVGPDGPLAGSVWM